MSNRLVAILTATAALLMYVWFRYEDQISLWTIYPGLPFFGRDFFGSYLVEAAMLKSGAYTSLWDVPANTAWQASHGFPGIFTDCPYPPLLASLFIPLTSMPAQAATLFWFHINATLTWILGVSLGWWSGRALGRWTRIALALAGGAALALSASSLDCLFSGQAGILVTGVTALYAWAEFAGRRRLAAVFLSLGISLKIYPVVFLLRPIISRDVKFLSQVAAGCVFWTLPVIAYTGASGPWIFYQYFSQMVTHLPFTGVTVEDQSLIGAMARLFGPEAGPRLGQVASLMLIGTTAWRIHRTPDVPAGRAYAIALLVMLQVLCLGRSWPHYHVALALTVACFLVSRRPQFNIQMLILFSLIGFQGMVDGEVTSHNADILLRQQILTASLPCLANSAVWLLLLLAPPTSDDLKSDTGAPSQTS